MKLEFSWQIFKKYLGIKFHENLFIGSEVVLCGQMDTHDKANDPILQTRLKGVTNIKMTLLSTNYEGWIFDIRSIKVAEMCLLLSACLSLCM